MFVAGDPVPFMVLVVAVVVHGRDGLGLANISLFSNAQIDLVPKQNLVPDLIHGKAKLQCWFLYKNLAPYLVTQYKNIKVILNYL